jgi:hypothetical protein
MPHLLRTAFAVERKRLNRTVVALEVAVAVLLWRNLLFAHLNIAQQSVKLRGKMRTANIMRQVEGGPARGMLRRCTWPIKRRTSSELAAELRANASWTSCQR